MKTYRGTERAIDDLAKSHPEVYIALDNLTDASDKSIDVNVSSDKSISKLAQNESNFDSATKTIHSLNINIPSRRALNTFLVMISSSQRIDEVGEKLAHEGGHIIYLASNPIYINSKKASLNCRDKSNHADTSVQSGIAVENNYIKRKRNYSYLTI